MTQEKQTKTITKRLPCLLSDAERLAFADQLAEANERVEEAVASRKSLMQQMAAEVNQAVGRKNLINGIVASKTEYRDIDVVVTFDFKKGKVIQHRKDTGEEIMNRPMTEKERQTNLLNEPELDESVL